MASPLGIANSPIQAPAYDLYGQLRVDDPNVNPQGLGSNPYKDRGAIEEADFIGPTALSSNPVDNDGAGLDRNPSLNQVLLVSTPISNFTIQFSDKGTGLDDSTITANRIVLTRTVNNVTTTLTMGVDFTIALDNTNAILRLTPSTAVWASGTYTITLDNSVSPIKDLVGNPLQANNNSGSTQFVVQISNTTVSPWQNPTNKYDVNADGLISPSDALVIINKLLLGQTGALASPTPYPPYIDVSGDGSLTAVDALQIINYLNLYGITPATVIQNVATPNVATPNVATANSASSPAVVSAATSGNVASSSSVSVASASPATPSAAAASSALDFNAIVSSAPSSPASAAASVAAGGK